MLSRNQKLIAVSGLLLMVGVFAFAPRPSGVRLVVAAGTPDAYNQEFYYIAVYQKSAVSGLWVLKANITSALYSAGYNVNINPNESIRFFSCAGINNGFATSEAEALSYTRSYITITGEVTRTLMTDDNATEYPDGLGTYYTWAVKSHYYWSPSGGKPIAGETYAVLFEFQGYFDPDDYNPP